MQTQSATPSRNQSRSDDRVLEIEARLARAQRFGEYATVMDQITERFAVPHRLIYEFVTKCPVRFDATDRDLRSELITALRDHILEGLTIENVEMRERKIMAFVQAGSFHSAQEFLKGRAFVCLLYKELNSAVPREILERMKTCEQIHRTRTGFRKADAVGAGYAVTHEDARQAVFVHKASGDSITIYVPKVEITGADLAQAKIHAAQRRNDNQAKRLALQPKKGAGGSKEVHSSKEKGKGKGGKKDRK